MNCQTSNTERLRNFVQSDFLGLFSSEPFQACQRLPNTCLKLWSSSWEREILCKVVEVENINFISLLSGIKPMAEFSPRPITAEPTTATFSLAVTRCSRILLHTLYRGWVRKPFIIIDCLSSNGESDIMAAKTPQVKPFMKARRDNSWLSWSVVGQQTITWAECMAEVNTVSGYIVLKATV